MHDIVLEIEKGAFRRLIGYKTLDGYIYFARVTLDGLEVYRAESARTPDWDVGEKIWEAGLSFAHVLADKLGQPRNKVRVRKRHR